PSFDWLDKAATAGFGNESQLANDADLSALHGDARWPKLVAKVHATAVPCEGKSEWHQFDFWIGEWDGTSPGTPRGHSRIEQILGQCVILENWSGLAGGSGKSFNTFDTASGHWRQFWVDDRGTMTEFTDGVYENGALRFKTSSRGSDGHEVLG